MAHTKGPWHVTTNRHPTLQGESWGRVEAVLHPAGGAGECPAGTTITWRGERGRANARLIAAAPATLDALRETVNALVLYVKLDNDNRAGGEIGPEDWGECHGQAEPALGRARAILDAAGE